MRLASPILTLLVGCSVSDPGSVPAQRLTPSEYNNTVRDLFGIAVDGDWPEAYNSEDEEEEESWYEDRESWPYVFPADIEVHGFEGMVDGQVSSSYLVERYQDAATHFAPIALVAPFFWTCSDQLDDLAEVPQFINEACAWDSVLRFTQRAWRRPITEAEQQRLQAFHNNNVAQWGIADGVILSVEGVLLTPQFLYRIESIHEDGGERSRGEYVRLSSWEMASRLSYLLWDSMPDAELFNAAASGKLESKKGIQAQAERMLRDVRARNALVRFHSQWLDLDAIYTANADIETYMPLYQPEAMDFELEDELLVQEAFEELWSAYLIGARAAMVHEAELFIAETLSGGGTLTDLLTSPNGYASRFGEEDQNHETWRIYGLSDEDRRQGLTHNRSINDGNFFFDIYTEPVAMPPAERSGVLTLGAVLAGKAHPVHPAPVLRGVFVLEHLACETLGQPPDSAAGTAPPDTLQADSTNRERVEAITSSTECIVCHDRINAAGFAFENYDSVGGYRTQDNGHPVDASGLLKLRDGETYSFQDANGLAAGLAQSRQVHDCYAQNWARYMLGTEPSEASLLEIQQRFFEDQGNVQGLLIDLVTSDMFRFRRAQP